MLQKSPMYAYLPVKDVARARQFYETKLGFVAKREAAGGVVYESAGGTACDAKDSGSPAHQELMSRPKPRGVNHGQRYGS